MDNYELKEKSKKIWNFIWKDDSIWSWIVSLILAFIIVKFIFFPLLSLALGTKLPLVVIESGSMQHDLEKEYVNNQWTGFYTLCAERVTTYKKISSDEYWNICGNWYESRGINKTEFEKMKFDSGMYIGDIIVLWGYGKPKIGDVIVFNAGQSYPIIHRVINITEKNNQLIYSTKGDHNPDQLQLEKSINENQIIGRSIIKIPKLGWIKLGFVKLFKLI